MKTRETTPGKSYSVHTMKGCTIIAPDGWQKTIEAPDGYFDAHFGSVVIEGDDEASIKELFKLAPYQKLRLLGVVGGNDNLPSGYTRLAYLMPAGPTSRLNAEIGAFSDTGCRVRGFFDSSRTSLFSSSWFLLLSDTLYWGPLMYWLPKTALGFREKNSSIYPQKEGLPDATSGNSVTNGYSLNGDFWVSYNWQDNMKWEFTNEGNSLERSLTGIGQPQYAENIIIFGRRSDLLDGWAGGMYELWFTRGNETVGHLVPVLNELGNPTMWDLIRKIELQKYTAGDFIAGIDTQAQFNNMLRKLPDRSGQEVGTLQVRLAEALQTEANLAALDAMVAKNWEISQAA